MKNYLYPPNEWGARHFQLKIHLTTTCCKKSSVYAWKNRDETICCSITPDWMIKCLFIALIIPNQIEFVSFIPFYLYVSIFCFIQRKLYVAIDARWFSFQTILIFHRHERDLRIKMKLLTPTRTFDVYLSEHKIFALSERELLDTREKWWKTKVVNVCGG
jgi:hypothetical protein